MRKKALLIRMEEDLFLLLKKASGSSGKSMTALVKEALSVSLALPVEMKAAGAPDFSKLADLLDIPENTVTRLARYFVDYLEFQVSDGLYHELGRLARFVVESQKGLSGANIIGIAEEEIPETSNQLEGILEATEEATNQILTSTETLLDDLSTLKRTAAMVKQVLPGEVVDAEDWWKMFDDFVSGAQNKLMEIFSACNFQDLTGQRIQKIVALIKNIEEKILDLVIRYDLKKKEVGLLTGEQEQPADEIMTVRSSQLEGPQRQQEAFQQDDIDSLLSNLGF